jgi:hypothetical protein
MEGFKKFYNEKKGKYILFFGFYLIFFIVLAIYIRSYNSNKPVDNNDVETDVITTYNLSNLINNDYKYSIVVIDGEETLNFNGSKNNIDYANFTNKYFLDIYNINQLLKRSKLISNEDFILKYELTNKEINDILLTNKEYGTNEIDVYVNNKGEVNKIYFDLASYLGRDIYQITIDYIVGENNENSAS